jgi:hypothetical protein
MNELNRAWRKTHVEHIRAYIHKTGRQRPMKDAKDSSSYLGVYIAERVLSRLFDHVTRMPYGNPGYDFLCGKGKKIDAKSACINQRGHSWRWGFSLKHNAIADYFLCIGFDDRQSLTPMHVWLIPRKDVTGMKSITITDSSRGLPKWEKYERPIDKVSECCEKMRVVSS